MSNTDKGPCPPTADLVAKETGNKEASKQSIPHIPWWPGGRGDGSWEGWEGGVLESWWPEAWPRELC